MSKKLYEETNIQGIAAAIREKNGTQNTYTTAQMANAVRAITTQPNLETLNATENGNYLPSAGKDGFSSVSVNVSGSAAVVQPLSATQNGTYTPPSGVDGYAPVTVNVSGSGGSDWENLTTYIESTGTQWVDTGYVPTSDSEFELVAKFGSSQPSFAMFFGARDTSSGTGGNPVLFGPGSSSFRIGWGFNLTTGASSGAFQNHKIIARVDKNGYDVRSKDSRPAIGSFYNGQNTLTSRSIYLFSLHADDIEFGSDTRCKTKLYRFRIFESGVLVHEFIPWQDNGVACLKDTVTGNLLYNSGTGDFVYGVES